MIARIKLMKLHALLAAFSLPIALMFFITGSLYTWGIKGSYTNTEYPVELTQALQPNLEALTALAITQLNTLNLSYPSGKAKIKTIGDHYQLEWTGAARDITIEATNDPLIAKLTVKETSWYRHLVQLHKAKGGVVFKVYAIIFAIIMGLLLISGCMMAWQTPKLKRLSMGAFTLGAISFLLVVSAS